MMDLTEAAIADASRVIETRLTLLPILAGARAIGCFMAKPREVQLGAFVAGCRAGGKRVCVPAFKLDDNAYGWAWLEDGQPLRQGRREP